MSKEFKKGQVVVHFHSWDRKGTWFFRRAVVKSCSAKQMTLEALDSGEMMGRNFRPDSSYTYTVMWRGDEYTNQHADRTMPDMSDEQAHAMCIMLAEGTLAQEREHFARCLTTSENPHYLASIKSQMAELHEPRSREYANRAVI